MSRSSMILLATISLLAGSAALYPQAIHADNDLPSIRFLWAFGALTGAKERSELVAITKDTALRSGDQIKMLIKPESACYPYVLYYTSQGELNLLFPANLSIQKPLEAGEYWVPEGNRWFELDTHTGPEIFYLIVSKNRLEHLEDLVNKHLMLNNRQDSASSAQTILTEMKNLRRRNLKLSAPAERPVRLGGNLRGTGEEQADRDIRRFSIEITAQDFFSRTFTIDHQ